MIKTFGLLKFVHIFYGENVTSEGWKRAMNKVRHFRSSLCPDLAPSALYLQKILIYYQCNTDDKVKAIEM